MLSLQTPFNKPQRVIFFLLVLLTVGHFLLLMVLTHNKYQMHGAFDASKIADAQEALIDLISHSSLPPDRLQQVINDFNRAGLRFSDVKASLSLTKTPNYNAHRYFNNQQTLLAADIARRIHHLEFSYELPQQYWLNYRVKPTENLYHATSWIAVIELAAIAILLFYAWSISRFTIPLQAFKESAEHLGISNTVKPLKIPGPLVVQETVSAINRMQQRIQDLIYTRTKLAISISHDLRTPITRLKLLSQLIPDKTIEHKLLSSLTEMEEMINIILEFARGDHVVEKQRTFDLVSLVATICEEMNDLGHTVIFNTPLKRIAFQGRKLAIKLAIVNLVTNAIKYGKNVVIDLNRTTDSIRLSVQDEGPGIPEDQIPHVFKPYYRASNYSQPGFGLGLAISAEIVHHHNGTLKLHNHLPQGLVATITLPCKEHA